MRFFCDCGIFFVTCGTVSNSYSSMDAPSSASGLPRVVLVNHSDSIGGAAVVTYRLLTALRRAGVDARMVVFAKTGSDPFVSEVGSRFLRSASFALERAQIAMSNGMNRSELFKVSTGHWAHGISSHPWVREADVVCLNWINQGLSSVAEMERLHRMGKKIVWTMHDMWAMTGICHHAYECANFTARCGMCPFLGAKARPGDLSAQVWKQKRDVYLRVPATYVAVSSWLAQRARESSLLRDQDVRVIPNAFPIDQFQTSSPNYLRGVSREEKPDIVIMGAARLDDPIKGLDYAVDALNHIFDNHPEVANRMLVVFFGDLRDRSRLDGLRMSHLWMGRVNDPKILRHVYACGKVVLSTSLYETLPGTLIEGQAAGCVPVTFGRGGQNDIVTHRKTGYIARYKDVADVAEGIMWAVGADVPRQMLHETVRANFAADVVAQRYIDLFRELTS